MNLRDSITALPGVGPKKAESFEKLGIETLEDLAYTFPRQYEDRREVKKIKTLEDGETAVFIGTVDLLIPSGFRGRRGQVLKLLVSDDTGSVEVVFFNASYLKRAFRMGETYVFYGRVSEGRMTKQVIHPDFSRSTEMETGILPVYPLTKGITQREMRRVQRLAEPLYDEATEILSEETIKRNGLCGVGEALKSLHFPKEQEAFARGEKRLVFEEFLVLETGLLAARGKTGACKGIAFEKDDIEKEYIAGLPYELTKAQKRCVKQIKEDLESDKAMNRLVQGDVGSGKTAIAEIAMFKAVKSDYQAALMAPTEILAKQHYDGMVKSFAAHGITAGFLSGSMKASEKREILSRLENQEIDILIGTHALIQEEVTFAKLGLVITDEQHRFGVNQRMKLKEKGDNINVLVMTATPIPRTLAVVLYGDLDVSIIDELPPGRQPIITRCGIPGKKWNLEQLRSRCYDFVEKQVAAGRQAYVVTPLIDESEVLDVISAAEVYEELSKRFEKIALIHGAMKQEEKDLIMEAFARGEIYVLVATVVIEVGINVPNATVMVVENAERFGLAQLHQLRGRVGRGTEQSYCFLIIGNPSELAEKRGKIMQESSDGFYIAEEDLKLRGPGEIFGTRQHGLPDMKLADMARHMDILAEARNEAVRILEADPELLSEENRPLRERVTKLFGEEMTLNL